MKINHVRMLMFAMMMLYVVVCNFFFFFFVSVSAICYANLGQNEMALDGYTKAMEIQPELMFVKVSQDVIRKN